MSLFGPPRVADAPPNPHEGHVQAGPFLLDAPPRDTQPCSIPSYNLTPGAPVDLDPWAIRRIDHQAVFGIPAHWTPSPGVVPDLGDCVVITSPDGAHYAVPLPQWEWALRLVDDAHRGAPKPPPVTFIPVTRRGRPEMPPYPNRARGGGLT